VAQIDLRPVRITRDPARRSVQLLAGLALYGTSVALVTRAGLGLEPWSVLAEGVLKHTGLTFGTVTGLISVVVLLLWIPLRQRPGIGTIANAAIIGFTVDLTLWAIPPVENLPVRIGLLVVSVVGNALAGALYIGAGLGPGPRDGLMTGLVARGVGSIRVVRTVIELTVLGIGWLLGGVVGVGTIAYALAIGPLLHVLLPRLQVGAPTQSPANRPDVIFQEEAR